jgi:hypothetical protein
MTGKDVPVPVYPTHKTAMYTTSLIIAKDISDGTEKKDFKAAQREVILKYEERKKEIFRAERLVDLGI